MNGVAARVALQALLLAGVWGVALPAALIVDETGSAGPPWRSWGVAPGSVLMLLGVALCATAGRQLAGSGAPLFGVRPGPVLVTDGLYGVLRNPQDVGATLISLGPPVAVDVPVLWIVPLIGLVYLAIGVEPLEDRHLLEAFGEEFRAYRSRVARWIPLR